jgi:hypothetical protein
VIGAVLVLALGAGTAPAQAPRGLTAPSYPGNTLTLAHDGPIVAGSVARVQMSGHAEWNRPTDEFTTPYDLYLFVQNAEVVPECAPWYGEQLQAGINLGLSASSSISGWVMEADLQVAPSPPASGTDWAGESVPFSVKPGLGDRALLCAYQRNITDDVASYQLPVSVEQPRCKPARRTVRRGARLRLECNVSGPVTVRFRGPSARTANGRISAKDGKGTVSTRKLERGRYRVAVQVGELRLGGAFKLRIR